MNVKDYYKILELEPSATLPEIKKAYRLLALQYHPDKNDNDPYSAALFTEIKEAYEVLTDPSKKEYYLQQRWYNQSVGRRKTQPVITPVNVLKQILELDKYVSRLDVHRMDKHGLHEYINGILTNETIEKLNTFNDKAVNKEIVLASLTCVSLLPFSLATETQNQLLKIKTDEITQAKIIDTIQSLQTSERWEKYKAGILLLIVLIISLLIFFLSKK